jgi:hypothetical protein
MSSFFSTSQATSRGKRVRLPAHIPSNDVDTSQAAARSLAGVAETLTEKVYAFVEAQGDAGATCDEVEIALGLRHQTASSRMWDLEGKARLRKTTATREARSGRQVRIYVVNRLPEAGT